MGDTLQAIERTIPASQFKTHCLALLDEVAESGVAIVVTKHGTPVARVEPIEPPPSLRGSVTYHVGDEELIAPLWENWDPELPVIVLDTHAFLWWRDEDPRLSAAALTAIKASDRIGVPTACCLEIATLDRRGRITLAGGATRWIRAALADPRVEEIPMSSEIALAAGELPETFPGDPVDRIIYATSRTTGSPLVTRDRRITSHDPRRAVW